MVVIGIISVAALAIWLAIWTDVMSREEEDREVEVDYRAMRFAELADTAHRLSEELGREPTVREIYAAIESDEREDEIADEPDEIEVGPVVDLRARVLRIKGDRTESSMA